MLFRAFAKINLGLKVLNKRADGFHNIETFFQQIDLHDDIAIEPTSDGRIHLTCSDKDCPTDAGNLAFRAAAMLKKYLNAPSLGCRIHIEKRIPMGGGLGGGSSDAATTILALNTLWGASLPPTQITELAAGLGSDVAFFTIGGLALGTGRGEKLLPIDDKISYTGILVYPGIHISTPWAYKNLNLSLTNSDKIGKFIDFIRELGRFDQWQSRLPNDLEAPVFRVHRSLQNIVAELYSAGAFYARMSGSGSSLYGLFDTPGKAEAAQSLLKNRRQAKLFIPIYR
ncbi:4-(cytidine 5'-diphospho)-2-C-methyl-D-erythritol kinase [candidate division KSB1 bacterium]|nr:MAG: 4-(cytidine 5'-diphospho)-2-C-methyl-D-erythritol kinase [candidate division KSB1 bacterium]